MDVLKPLTTVVPYVFLALLAAVTVVAGFDPVNLTLCALAALWILAMYTLRPARRDSPRQMGVFLAGLLLITLVLVLRDPWYALFTPACYFYAFRIIGWPAELYFIGGTAAVAGIAQASGLDPRTPAGLTGYAVTVLANAVPLCGLAWLIRISERREREREAALGEARAANERLATALAENADLQQQLLTQARTAGVLDERQRMAGEIHDTVAQGLIGIVTQLQAAAQAPGEDWRRHHDAATDLARESLTEARRSVHALRPRELESGRLDEALAEVATRWSTRLGLTVEFTTTGTSRPLPPEAEAVLLRTAQEALANVSRHASATRVGITLSYLDHDVALDVRDDGRGFDPTAPRPPTATTGGFGLVAMRRRIEGLAGTLAIESEPGAGTGISACLPAAA
ncbi:signal transduction histidine kinase [Actinoplanes tereljensis]|uniref:Oxygen sensor histidine kinase NreB n=1 Tax=Paractinoplanes tereljensis TaxID=571912 RepID=A0A919NPA2_9ACTN|nr:sensor histidine kinase [Actinoplanes tereljensis]GIF21823.1 histidine kinase [Actinoplanes tereljensis]